MGATLARINNVNIYISNWLDIWGKRAVDEVSGIIFRVLRLVQCLHNKQTSFNPLLLEGVKSVSQGEKFLRLVLIRSKNLASGKMPLGD